MNQTKGNEEKKVEVKIPFFIPVIVIVVFGVLTAKIYASNSDNNIVTNTVIQEEIEEEQVEEQIIPEQSEVREIEETEKEKPKTVTYTATDGKQYEVIATLKIPSLGIEYPILSSTSEALLKVSLNKYWGANPNEVGNMVVLGHNYENTKFFSKLPNIKIGNIVKITDLTGKTLDYEVYETDIIDPDDNSCTSQLTDGHTEITLITCYNKGAQRFIAKARAK